MHTTGSLPRFALLFCGFFSLAETWLPADTTNPPPKVSIETLLAQKNSWKDKRVEVSGFYVSGVEKSALYRNEAEATNAVPAESLWIDFRPLPGHRKDVKWIKSGYLRTIGTFKFRPGLGSGHLGQWPAEITRLEVAQEIPQPGNGAAEQPDRRNH